MLDFFASLDQTFSWHFDKSNKGEKVSIAT
jgi:hypothetical protein